MQILILGDVCLSTDISYPRNSFRQLILIQSQLPWNTEAWLLPDVFRQCYSSIFCLGQTTQAWVTDIRSLLWYFPRNQLHTSLEGQILSAVKRWSKPSYFIWHNKSTFATEVFYFIALPMWQDSPEKLKLSIFSSWLKFLHWAFFSC